MQKQLYKLTVSSQLNCWCDVCFLYNWYVKKSGSERMKLFITFKVSFFEKTYLFMLVLWILTNLLGTYNKFYSFYKVINKNTILCHCFNFFTYPYRGRSRGRVQGVLNPLAPIFFVFTSKICLPHQSVMPFLSNATPPKKTPGSPFPYVEWLLKWYT